MATKSATASPLRIRIAYICLAFALIIFTISTVAPSRADQLSLEEGSMLVYKWARVSSGTEGMTTGDATFEILAANQTVVVIRATGTATVTLTIKYQDGIPIYTEHLEALIYLPPECIAQSLKGNLDWAKQLQTLTAIVTNGTVQQQEFTVEAGTFQSLNITLNLVGPMYGNLTLIYDVNSGILLYEQWIPEYGDIIVQTLYAVTQAAKPQNIALSILLAAATFATPAAITIKETRKTLRKRKPENKNLPKDTGEKGVFPRKAFYLILTGATLNLASTLMPWSQLAEKQMYLPLSLSTALTATTTLIPAAVSLTAHAAAITAWIGIAVHLYTNRKLSPQLAILASSMLSFASAAILIQSGWTPYLGAPVAAVGGALTILGIAATNIKIEIITEQTEDKSAS